MVSMTIEATPLNILLGQFPYVLRLNLVSINNSYFLKETHNQEVNFGIFFNREGESKEATALAKQPSNNQK